jgi:hypothetical protein
MKLPVPLAKYDMSREADRNRQIEQSDRLNHKRGQDIYVSPGKLLLTSADGTVYDANVTNTGQLRTGETPDYLIQTAVYGQLFYGGVASVSIGTAGTYVTTGLTGVLDADISEGFVLGVTDALGLKNDSGRTIRTPVYASYDGRAGNNKTLGLKLAVNGVAIDATECRAATGSVNSLAKLVTRWIIQLEPDDEVSIFVANHTDTVSVQIDRARIIAG